ncbi:MAG TPA: alpha/beta hydrolase [Anaerolineae bacterium]|nr:alpha/beta hydrolase [Caldilineae bacterium]HID35024.1 alpha/beta hydrolase [Anaerolineae bacterium]
MTHTETVLTSFDDTPIFLRAWTPDDAEPRAALMLVHGLAEHAGRYQFVVDAFLQQGYMIYGHDHRGFGKSGGVRGHWEHFEDVLKDMDMIVRHIRDEHPDLPFGMFAHSMGGTIGVHYLYRDDNFDAAALSSPGFGPGPDQNQRLLKLIPILARIIPRKPLDRGRSEEYRLSHDPAQARAWDADPLVHPYATPRWAVEYLRAAREAKALLPQLTLPLLVIMGEADVTVDTSRIRAAVAAAGPNVTFRTYPGAYHEVHNEIPEIREPMIKDLVAWMNDQLFSRPKSD